MWILLLVVIFLALTLLMISTTLQLNFFAKKLDQLAEKLESHIYL